MASVKDVAKVVVQKSPGISHLKLQKLLYYVQGWSLGLLNKPAFEASIEAWVHGPVVPEIFHAYKGYRWNPIDVPQETVYLDQPDIELIENVLNAYGHLSATQLEQISHDESPWLNARVGLAASDSSRKPISHEAMRTFFKSQANV